MSTPQTPDDTEQQENLIPLPPFPNAQPIPASQLHGFIHTHHTDLKSYIRPSGTEVNVSHLWKCILARVKLKQDDKGEGKNEAKGRGRCFDVRTEKVRTMYSEKHFVVLGSVGRRVCRRHNTGDGGVEKQVKTILLVEPRDGPTGTEVLGSKEELEKWWDGMLMPRFKETLGENWERILGREGKGVSVALAAGTGVRFFWAVMEEGGVVLERAHGKSVLDLREGRDQDTVETLLEVMLERAWDGDGQVPWEGVEVGREGLKHVTLMDTMEWGDMPSKSLMYRPVV